MKTRSFGKGIHIAGKSSLATDRDLPGGRRSLDEDSLALQKAFVDLTLDSCDGCKYLGYIDVVGRRNISAFSQGVSFWPGAGKVMVAPLLCRRFHRGLGGQRRHRFRLRVGAVHVLGRIASP